MPRGIAGHAGVGRADRLRISPGNALLEQHSSSRRFDTLVHACPPIRFRRTPEIGQGLPAFAKRVLRMQRPCRITGMALTGMITAPEPRSDKPQRSPLPTANHRPHDRPPKQRRRTSKTGCRGLHKGAKSPVQQINRLTRQTAEIPRQMHNILFLLDFIMTYRLHYRESDVTIAPAQALPST